MRKFIFLFSVLSLLHGCNSSAEKNTKEKLPRVAIAGIGIESSTFSPATTDEAAFHARIGDSIFGRYHFFADTTSIRQRPNGYPPYWENQYPEVL